MVSHDRTASSQPLSSLATSRHASLSRLQTAGNALGEALPQIPDTVFPESLDPRIFGDSSQLGSPLGFVMDHRSDLTMGMSSYDDQESLLGIIEQNHAFNKAISMLGDQPQHCIGRALDLLQELHAPPAHCSLASSLSASSPSLSPASTRTIDQVLATNKEILVVVHQMLDCPCSLNIQLAFMLTTIVSKIICWYSAAAQSPAEREAAQDAPADSPPSRCGTSSTGNSNSMATSPPPTVASPEYVSVHTRVTVGKYNLEGNNKAKMRAQLVLSELHLVLRLVEKLVARFRCIQLGEAGAAAGDLEAGATPPMFVEMERFLRDRLRMLAKETTDVLRLG